MRAISVVIIVAALAAPRLARADAKLEFLCGTFKDGAAQDVLPSAKKPKIVDPIGCALRITNVPSGWEDMLEVYLYTVRYTGGKKVFVNRMDGKLARGDDGNLQDIEWMINPGDKNDDGTDWFAPCEDFDIVAHVGGPGGVKYDKKIHVAQSCPKPKPIAAKVTCTATQQGESWNIPTKKPYRLSDAAIRCIVAPKDKRAKIGDLTVSGWIDHADGTGQGVQGAHHDADIDPVDEGTWVEYLVDFTNDDYAECMPGTITLQAKNADGAVVFTKSIDLNQTCDD